MQILHKTTSTVGSITRPPWDIALNVRLLMMMIRMTVIPSRVYTTVMRTVMMIMIQGPGAGADGQGTSDQG